MSLTAGEIARRRRIPEKFLARLLSGLARSGVVLTARGPNGGARLARPPVQVSLIEVLPTAGPALKGGVAAIWLAQRLDAAEKGTLAGLTLAALLEIERAASQPSYEV